MKNLGLIGNFAAANDNFITSADALIDYNPILAGQSSPFKVMATYNPEIKHWRVEFKDLLGGSITFTNSSTKCSLRCFYDDLRHRPTAIRCHDAEEPRRLIVLPHDGHECRVTSASHTVRDIGEQIQVIVAWSATASIRV